MKRTFLLLIISLTSVGSAYAESIVQTKGPVTLEIRHDGKRQQIALADLIMVELRVEGSNRLRVDPPRDAPSGWTLVKRLPVVTERFGEGRMRWRLTHWFAPQSPGAKVLFDFLPVKYEDDEETHVVKFTPVYFSITTQIANADPSQLRGKVDIEVLPLIGPPDQTHFLWPALFAAAVFLAVLILMIRRLWRSKTRPSPAHLALQEWHRLIALRLPEKGCSERFITLLTLLVRQYVERQYSLPARRRTTREFLGQLAKVSTLADEQKQFLSSFLERAEHVKFAQVPLTADECMRWADEVRRFIEPQMPRVGIQDEIVRLEA